MEHHEREDFVSIWAGNLNSRAGFDRFFEERIEEDASIEDPLNNFAASIGVGFYDHDSQEAVFNDDGTVSLPVMLEPLSFSTSYINQAAAAADQSNLGEINTVMALYDFYYGGTVKADAPLRFVGAFAYDKTAR